MTYWESFSFLSVLVLSFAVALPFGSPLQAETTRILSVETYDQGAIGAGASPSLSIDLRQDLCGEAPDQTDEPFFDTVVGVTVRNSIDRELTITGIRYRLRTAVAGPMRWTRSLAPSSPAIIPSKSERRVLGLMLKADGGSKKAAGSSSFLSDNLGFQNIMVRIALRDANGRRFHLQKRLAMAFGNYDRCS